MEHEQRTVTAEQRNAAIAALGLTYTATFIPQSQSRNADAKHKSLNWHVRVTRNGVTIAADYTQGIAHVPGYQTLPRTLYFERLQQEYDNISETGKYPDKPTHKHVHEHGTRLDINPMYRVLPLPSPDLADVLYTLVSDATDAPYDYWCGDYGYDTDSRKAFDTYQTCVDIGFKLRRMLGDDGLRQLRDLFQDY